MSKIVLTAETGSDITAAQATEYGIHLVPMHVTFGERILDDGTFPPEEICDYYTRTGLLPKTSGSSPEDFAQVFAGIHTAHPLHLAYSAATTVSYQSALLAANGRDYVTCLDTKQASIGQANIVLAMARLLAEDPGLPVKQAVLAAEEFVHRARFCFIPYDLEYLRAGGRISNVAYFLGGRLLHLHPCVEMKEGKLIATKKYRGSMERAVRELIRTYSEEQALSRDHLWMLYTVGFSEELRQAAQKAAEKLGFRKITWAKAQGVITTHGGPGAFAMAGFSDAVQ